MTQNNLTDLELIREILDGDTAAFRILVERHQNKVINICYGFVHNYDDAEDLAQDVFIEVFQSLARFRAESGFSTWLYRIAVNKSLNFIKKNKRKKLLEPIERLLGLSNEKIPHSTIEASDSELLDQERRKIVYKAIDSLPESQRLAFTLHKIENISYAEVAETMKISLPAVESLIHRAKMNLKVKLLSFYQGKL